MPDDGRDAVEPFRVLRIHPIEEAPSQRYWYPALDPVDDGPVLEAGENVLLAGTAKIHSERHNGTAWIRDWSLPERCAFTITDRRLVLSCRKVATAHVPAWLGGPPSPIIGGRASSTSTNKARARHAWSGHIATGHLRLAWSVNLILDCPKGAGSSGETKLTFTTQTGDLPYRVVLAKTDPELRRADVGEVAAAAAAWRLRRLTPEQRATPKGGELEEHRHDPAGIERAVRSQLRTQILWTIPFPVWEEPGRPPRFALPRPGRPEVSRFWPFFAAASVLGWGYDAFGIHTVTYPLSWSLIALTCYAVYVYRGGRWTIF